MALSEEQKAKARARSKAYYEAHRDEVRAKKAARYADDPSVRKADAKRGKKWRKENREYDLAMQQERYQENREERLAKAKEYQQAHKEEHKEAVKRYRKRNREKVAKWNHSQWDRHREELRGDFRDTYNPRRSAERVAYEMARQQTLEVQARKTLRTAVRRGEVVKPEFCESCRKPTLARRLHGHHQDYSKPLAVVWLCSICHAAHHRKVGSVPWQSHHPP